MSPYEAPDLSDADIGIEEAHFVPYTGLRPLLTEEELKERYPDQRRDLKCADCGNRLVLKDGKYGIFYGCVSYPVTGCKGAHNCSKRDATPFGIPGNAETRKARKEAHDWFDKVRGGRDADDTYAWLARELKLSPSECHMANFDLPMCQKAILAMRIQLGEYTRAERALDKDIV